MTASSTVLARIYEEYHSAASRRFTHVFWKIRGNGVKNNEVSIAVAEVATHQLADLLQRMGVAFCNQVNGRANLAGCALEGVVLDEGLLQQVQIFGCSAPFYHGDLGVVETDSKQQTCNFVHAVHKH